MIFNRRNCQLRPNNALGLGDIPGTIGRHRLANICNMDETPLPFEYLEGQTYSKVGEKRIRAQSSSTSGWDKRQGTIQITVFADRVPRVKSLVFFRGKGIGPTIVTERRLHDNCVIVKFTSAKNILPHVLHTYLPVSPGNTISPYTPHASHFSVLF